MAVSEAQQLLARGSTVTLRDGHDYQLIFDFEALCVLEEEVGGLEPFADRLIDPAHQYRIVRTGMLAGLAYLQLPRAELVKLLNPKDKVLYLMALSEAFIEAMPTPDPAAPKAQGSRGRSPGRASTGSRRSSSAAATRSSGA